MTTSKVKQDLAQRQSELAARRAALQADEAELQASFLPVIQRVRDVLTGETAQGVMAELRELSSDLPVDDLLAQSVAAGLNCLEQAGKQADQRIAHAVRQAERAGAGQ